MISFKNDYSELLHEDILMLLQKSMDEQNIGYGLDIHSQNAITLIKNHIDKNVDIHLLIGGTSTNKIAISHILNSYEAVISADTGHINVHEAGAIEANGNKIITIPNRDGKLYPEDILEVIKIHEDDHMVSPKLVYISNTTEVGTIYTKQELTNLSVFCKEHNLYLFLDGARLGVALTNRNNDLSLNDIAILTDAFYIGGTKNGALLGEALVIVNDKFKPFIRRTIKQNGGMLAKGFLIGIQFEGLFTNNLFFKLGKHANDQATKLEDGLKELNIKFTFPPVSNQLFITLNNKVIQELSKKYLFEIWEKGQDLSSIRLVTSWATKDLFIENFLLDLKNLL